MNFEDLFKAFERKATSGSPIGMELLVANAPLRIYYGISPQGFYRLAFMSQVVPPDFPSTRAIKVSVVKESDEAHWIFFDLVDGVAQLNCISFYVFGIFLQIFRFHRHVRH